MRMVRTKRQGQVKKFTLFKKIGNTFTLKKYITYTKNLTRTI